MIQHQILRKLALMLESLEKLRAQPTWFWSHLFSLFMEAHVFKSLTLTHPSRISQCWDWVILGIYGRCWPSMRERNKRLQGREAKTLWKPVMLGNAASIHPSIWFLCVFVLFSTYQSLIKYMSPLKRVLNTFFPLFCIVIKYIYTT